MSPKHARNLHPHKVLGIETEFPSDAEVKTAFRQQALALSAGTGSSPSNGSFTELKHAYELLTADQPRSKFYYDCAVHPAVLWMRSLQDSWNDGFFNRLLVVLLAVFLTLAWVTVSCTHKAITKASDLLDAASTFCLGASPRNTVPRPRSRHPNLQAEKPSLKFDSTPGLGDHALKLFLHVFEKAVDGFVRVVLCDDDDDATRSQPPRRRPYPCHRVGSVMGWIGFGVHRVAGMGVGVVGEVLMMVEGVVEQVGRGLETVMMVLADDLEGL
ncbi:hypothetical protein HDU96_000260 [Phlyctochytrium bullatum]|nr:hypothetical protein HDU96_000260 [Phlyctochytrium bullatum]